ncbi:MAG: hypothetical protein KC996_06540 [Phycisphaerales bacterium]|nr:hypothetical protein [Phycisphaerales bacterium]
MNISKPIALTIAAGSLTYSAAGAEPVRSPRATISSSPTTHIYYNIATGEQIATNLNTQTLRDAIDPGETVWVADNHTPCAAFGQTSGTSVILDNPNDYFGTGAAPETRTLMNDWADIPPDTIVDCFQLSYATGIQDTDTNSDGIADGVVGFGLNWGFYEENNGFNDCRCGQGLIGFTLTGLPGQLDGLGGFASAELTIDLASDFDNSLVMEFGDSDGDLNSAVVHNPFVFVGKCGDRDDDGLSDFSYTIQFIQPGTLDTDNADSDSDSTTGIDGNPALQDATGVPLAHYRGTTIEIDNGDGTFSYEITTAPGPNAYGAEEGWDEFSYPGGFYDATYWMGGFSCNSDGNGDINAYSQIALTMYGPENSICCPADFNCDGVIDIFDVFEYLDAFNAGDSAADFTNDGQLDIFDVFTFIDTYNAGCP